MFRIISVLYASLTGNSSIIYTFAERADCFVRLTHTHWYYFLTQWYTEASGADEDKENRPDTSDMEEADNSIDKDLSNQLDDVFNTQNSDSSQDSQAAFQ